MVAPILVAIALTISRREKHDQFALSRETSLELPVRQIARSNPPRARHVQGTRCRRASAESCRGIARFLGNNTDERRSSSRDAREGRDARGRAVRRAPGSGRPAAVMSAGSRKTTIRNNLLVVLRVLDPGPSSRSRARGASLEQNLKIGLVGRNSRFGLGHQNRDIAVKLNIDRWLVPLAGPGDLPPIGLRCRTDVISRDLSDAELEAWLDGLDVVLFVESPSFPALPEVAREMDVRVVCVPNWEWLHPGLPWLDDIDLMLCPTRHTARLLTEWKTRFRFSWRVETLPWPVDTDHFRFRRRFRLPAICLRKRLGRISCDADRRIICRISAKALKCCSRRQGMRRSYRSLSMLTLVT